MLIALRIWILFSAGLACSGWVLSALHEFKPFGISWLGLNPLSYLLAFAVMLAGAGYVWRRSGWRPKHGPRRAWRVFRRRFRRPAPRLFLLLVVLSVLGGVCYPPNANNDASMYREPRVLHWLAAQQWQWVHTFDMRMNIANCGFEWMTAPLVLFTHTDRCIFLIDLISYALLPGLFFKLFRSLQVRARVAWWWMWLLAGAFCYTLQAASLSNDAFAAVFAVAAVVFALEVRRSRKPEDLWISFLALALVTGVKQTYLPLSLLWLIAAWPSFRLLTSRLPGTVAVAVAGGLVSALPMVVLNLCHDGNWVGAPNHPGLDWEPWKNMESNTPFWSVVGNVFSLSVQNLVPPFFPMSPLWNHWMVQVVQTSWGSHFSTFPDFCFVPTFLSEQTAGLGLTVCGLLLLSLFWTWWWRRWHPSEGSAPVLQIQLLHWVPIGLLVLFMAKLRVHEGVRQLCPYYPFLVVWILVQSGEAALVRRRWWQRLALLSLLVSVFVLLFLPIRPLWPAHWVFQRLADRFPHSAMAGRAESLYSLPQITWDCRHCFAGTLPPAETVIGYATDRRSLEPSLWVPFTRRVERVRPDDSRAYLDSLGIHYAVVDRGFMLSLACTLDDVLKKYDASLVDRLDLYEGWGKLPESIYLIRLNPH